MAGAVRRREAVARELGLATALLVVPDKLAVYEEHYPEELRRVGPRPVERLLADAELPIFYPLADLRAAAQPARRFTCEPTPTSPFAATSSSPPR